MRPYFLPILAGFLLAACTIQQENGNDVRLAPPLLVGNHWRISQQSATEDGRVCTVSAGEMDVTQRAQGKTVAVQVAASASLNPGDYYRVIYGNDVHEAPSGQGWFDAAESQAIVHDLAKGGVVYTEIQARVIRAWGNGGDYERQGNKIDLSGFAAVYKKCQRFVSGSGH